MGRTNTIWKLTIYYNEEKTELIKTINMDTLKDLSHLLNCELYDVSNFYHKITKPKGIFKYLILTKL